MILQPVFPVVDQCAFCEFVVHARSPFLASYLDETEGARRSAQRKRRFGRTTELDQALTVKAQFWLLTQPGANFAEDTCGTRIRWVNDAVMHPLTFAPCADYACLPQIRQMARDGRLWRLQHFGKKADANLVTLH